MRVHLRIVLGLLFVLAGVILMAISVTPKPVPPVNILMQQSGSVDLNGVYFDSIAIQNYGSTNVTVVVVIQDLIDTRPRISDPVTLCPGCTVTVQIEAVQPAPNLSYDQFALYTKQLNNPQSISVEYLSTALQSRINGYLTAGGAIAILIGLLMVVRSLRPNRSRSIRRKRSRARSRA